MTSTGELSLDTADDAASVLAYARSQRVIADRAEAELLAAAARYAAIHPGDGVITEQDWHEASMPLAGPGAPDVAEFCVAEFAAALGMSTDAGRRYLGDAVEVHHRLPGVRARLDAGDLPAWRARRIAQATISLPEPGAAYVDRHVAPVAHRVGISTLDRLVEEARVRFDPEEAEARALDAAEARHAKVHLAQVGVDGVVDISAAADLPDALDLEHALRAGAAQLAEQGSTDSLDVRRAKALGLLARGQLTLDRSSGRPDVQAGPTRTISLHLHAAADPSSPLIRVEETRSFVLIDRLAEWCTNPGTQLDVKPVIDLAEHISVEAYEVPDRLADQVRLRDLVCVFPGCSRPARRCDCDHRVPYDQGGPTCTCNIAPLCRGHHRLKTQAGWTYTVLEPGSYLWASPYGYTYLRDHLGTVDVTPPRRPPPDVGRASPELRASP
jgi:hypothetical protein